MKSVYMRPEDTITLLPYVGSNVFEVASEMTKLAEQWNCTIKVGFSGVTLLAIPGRSSRDIVNYYNQQIDNTSSRSLQCVSNNLESLKGCPTKTTGFRYSGSNEIQSLKGYPTKEETC